MRTITSLGEGRAIRREWDSDTEIFSGWRTRPVWLQAVENREKRVNLAGLGDVGMNTALGLILTGAGLVDSIGLYDLNADQCARLETEFSQIMPPPGQQSLPAVRILRQEELFDCDIFLFCATRSIPAVGSGVKDVRMAQYEANRRILAFYAQEAAKKVYKGLFVVVSDPVDLLCMEALRTSRKMCGNGRPLTTDQIIGCGLGVMHARASYFAARHPEWSLYLTEGRAFGPHGEDLVIANSLDPAH
ncbi:MAG: lactate dehydrogenase, partial [Lachnospiraceae bacterium]|nr:lactate dehydrogenase [Lachnospiraceae bacterium]